MFQQRFSIALLLLVFATGCTVTQPAEPPALANTAREQIGHMAIRGPTRPTVLLADDLDGKGAAAGKTALSASAGWLGGTMEAAAQSGDEGGLLLVAFGLVTTPIVAAGGAAYGAAVADNPKTVLAGNEVIAQSLDFAPAHLRQTLEQELATSAPVSWAFVEVSASNQELLAAGFDSVLDVQMQTIASRPTANRILVYFETVNQMQLTSLRTGQLLSSRSYRRDLEPRAVSGWADRDAASLTTALEASFTDISAQTIDELFLAPAIRVKGLEPVSRGLFGPGTIPGRRPLFVWTALDGGSAQPTRSVEYELLISSNRKEAPLRHRTHNMRFVPADSLAACRTYRWQVRAHYTSFGEPVATDWTPEYRFKNALRRLIMLIDSSNNHLKIGDWQVEPLRTRIRRREQVRSVQPLSMDILVHLARRAGEVVTTDELIDEFWPGRYVGSDAVHRRIADLRRALGDDRSEPRYIETIRKRGYRLIAEVQRAEVQHTGLQGQQAADLLLDALDQQRDLHLEFELKNGRGTLARGTLSLSANAAAGVSPPATRPGCRSRYRAGS